jgi:hypothetical protein
MAIQDTNPERRNLVVVSLAFIVYFYGGGVLLEPTIRLQLINIQFTKPHILEALAWILFVWTLWRYWLINKGKFSNNLRSETDTHQIKKRFKKYIENKGSITIVDNSELGFQLAGIYYKNYLLEAVFNHCNGGEKERAKLSKEELRKLDETSQKHSLDLFTVRFNNLKGITYSLQVFFKCCLTKPSFTSYIAPYILALIALAGYFLN